MGTQCFHIFEDSLRGSFGALKRLDRFSTFGHSLSV